MRIRFTAEIDVEVNPVDGETAKDIVKDINEDIASKGTTNILPQSYFEDLPDNMTCNKVIKVEEVPEGTY